jgi:hypothetical protein
MLDFIFPRRSQNSDYIFILKLFLIVLILAIFNVRIITLLILYLVYTFLVKLKVAFICKKGLGAPGDNQSLSLNCKGSPLGKQTLK